jgi:hypothetical protein
MSRRVHFAQPSGTLLHAIATMCASSSPVILGSTGAVTRFLRLRLEFPKFEAFIALTIYNTG